MDLSFSPLRYNNISICLHSSSTSHFSRKIINSDIFDTCEANWPRGKNKES